MELCAILSQKFENDIWCLDDMLKCLKTEVEVKERLMLIGTSSELEKENKDRKYKISSFLNNAKGKWCPSCESNNHVASTCFKVKMLHPESKPCIGKDCVLYVLNQLIWQALVILSTNVISVTRNIIQVFVPSRKVTILRTKTMSNLMT